MYFSFLFFAYCFGILINHNLHETKNAEKVFNLKRIKHKKKEKHDIRDICIKKDKKIKTKEKKSSISSLKLELSFTRKR